jgi:hypothetical protein
MKEKLILEKIMLSFSALNARLFRNNVGMLEDRNGQKVKYGLCTGSSDLIGWKRVTITPEMVGRTVAIFLAVEVKAGKTKTTEQQINFIEAVGGSGGIAMVVHSEEEAVKTLKEISWTRE